MRKIDAIIKGKKFVDKLFGVKKRVINRALDDALDNIERQKINAQVTYEELLVKLADDNFDIKHIINQMIAQRQIILNSEETVKAIQEIKEDLNSEVEEENVSDDEKS